MARKDNDIEIAEAYRSIKARGGIAFPEGMVKGWLERRGHGLGCPGPRRPTRRLSARGRFGGLLLRHRLQARGQKQTQSAQDKGGSAGYSHPTNSTSSIQMSKAAPGTFTCH